MRTWRIVRGREGDLAPARGGKPFVTATSDGAALPVEGGAVRILPETWHELPHLARGGIVRCTDTDGVVEDVILTAIRNTRA